MSAEFDAYSDSYNDVVNGSVAFTGLTVDVFTRVKADYLKDIVGETFAEPETVDVLDVGCGVGNYHPHLAGVVRSVSGVDVSPDCIANARIRNPDVHYQVYDGHRLPWPDASFNVVYTVCVMHHVVPDQWTGFAAEMRRVLRPGGIALVFEHNPLNPLTRRAVANCIFDKDAVLLRSRTAETLLAGAGLRDVRSRFILSVPAVNRTLRQVDRLFSKLPLGAQYVTRGAAA